MCDAGGPCVLRRVSRRRAADGDAPAVVDVDVGDVVDVDVGDGVDVDVPPRALYSVAALHFSYRPRVALCAARKPGADVRRSPVTTRLCVLHRELWRTWTCIERRT
jgi:hypothetical protein